ncbi:MAG: hypothetical protein KAS63_10920 [Candidatus Heimdallarchaeota archaeon]|nr:hypothetical protein [Candidatus Heimdallarchaeota archaeon]MCK4955868.1 hypothetical protein [Candidatus Heimdallarchaeota archaeon]
MDLNKEKNTEESPEIAEITDEIEKLTEEVKVVKEEIRNSKRKREILETSSGSSIKEPIEITPAIEYISYLLENSSEQIVSEMKSEFFRLFNFLSSMLSVTPNHLEKRSFAQSDITENGEELDGDVKQKIQAISINEREDMLKLLLDERESLVYELSDQIVAIEVEKKSLQDKVKLIEENKLKWERQKNVLEKLVTTDPRFNIINLLRRMGVIAPIQLSFVLGVSLSQTNKYIQELEKMQILKLNEDETVSLHPAFDEDTMNIRIEINNNNEE